MLQNITRPTMATTCHGLAEFLGRRLSIISLTLLLAQIPDVRGHAKVMLVSFDGFRWDYLDTYANLNLSNFQRFAEEGTRAPYINSTFATFTFPTHYTMATGNTLHHGQWRNCLSAHKHCAYLLASKFLKMTIENHSDPPITCV